MDGSAGNALGYRQVATGAGAGIDGGMWPIAGGEGHSWCSSSASTTSRPTSSGRKELGSRLVNTRTQVLTRRRRNGPVAVDTRTAYHVRRCSRVDGTFHKLIDPRAARMRDDGRTEPIIVRGIRAPQPRHYRRPSRLET